MKQPFISIEDTNFESDDQVEVLIHPYDPTFKSKEFATDKGGDTFMYTFKFDLEWEVDEGELYNFEGTEVSISSEDADGNMTAVNTSDTKLIREWMDKGNFWSQIESKWIEMMSED